MSIVRMRRAASALIILLTLIAWTAADAQAQAPKAPLPVEVVNTPLPVTATSPLPVTATSPLPVTTTSPLPVIATSPLPVVPSSPVQVVATTPLAVSLTGTATVRDADNPARVPYQTTMQIALNHTEFANSNQVSVPAGKVFVVEFVTARAQLQANQRVRLTFFVHNGVSIVQHYFAPTYVGTDISEDHLVLNQSTRLYAKTGGNNYAIAVNATRFDGTGNQGIGSVFVSFSGYLVDE